MMTQQAAGDRMRLYRDMLDRCLTDPHAAAKQTRNPTFADFLTKEFPQAVPFDFTLLDDWLDDDLRDMNNRQLADWISRLPPCVPPYSRVFAEGRFCRSAIDAFRAQNPGTSLPPTAQVEYGALVLSEKNDDGSFSVTSYIYSNVAGRVMGPLAEIALVLDEHGVVVSKPLEDVTGLKLPQPLLVPNATLLPLPPFDDGRLTEGIIDAGTAIDGVLAVALYATAISLFGFAILNCKNVTEAHARLPRQQSRQRERKNLPPIIWKTLVVEPMTRPKTAEQVADSLDPKHARRLHMCRGHFREYGSDGRGLLFGKYSGRYWIPPTVKGAATAGLVAKNYRIGNKRV